VFLDGNATVKNNSFRHFSFSPLRHVVTNIDIGKFRSAAIVSICHPARFVQVDNDRVLMESDVALAFLDAYPMTEGLPASISPL
jgi:hypothetical protein